LFTEKRIDDIIKENDSILLLGGFMKEILLKLYALIFVLFITMLLTSCETDNTYLEYVGSWVGPGYELDENRTYFLSLYEDKSFERFYIDYKFPEETTIVLDLTGAFQVKSGEIEMSYNIGEQDERHMAFDINENIISITSESSKEYILFTRVDESETLAMFEGDWILDESLNSQEMLMSSASHEKLTIKDDSTAYFNDQEYNAFTVLVGVNQLHLVTTLDYHILDDPNDNVTVTRNEADILFASARTYSLFFPETIVLVYKRAEIES